MIIKKHKLFDKSYLKLSQKLKLKVNETLVLITKNHFDKKLNNHALKGDFIGLRSINVTGDYRIIFKEISDNNYEIIELLKIGTHSELYK
ncbi:MAG: type II toxin-antitoxin system mRNA interferase toxin, RelE/StbE family [Candidatus Gracilibacteria bacterium]|nr:type II toxin-antitoxin system mRNA interferase toxin, RelE/StbE family [Candidatus Gracilibacteria bacterium]